MAPLSATLLLLTESPAQATIVGVIICLCANVVISLALNCQKLAHTRLQQQQQQGRESSGHEADESSDGESPAHGSPSLALSPTATQNGSTPQDENVLGVVVVVDKNAAEQRARNENLPLLSPQQTRDGSSKYGAAGRGSDGEQASGSTSTSGTLRGDAGGKTPASSSDDGASESENQGPTTQFLRSKLWWLGFGLMVLGESGNFLSYGFAPASLVAPLGAVALLSNVIISPFLLKERFQASDLFGIFLCIVGAVTVVFASRDSDVRLGPDGLLKAIMRREFVAYSITACALGAILASMSRTKWGERFVLIDIGVCAIFGGFTVLSTKGISSLLSGGRPLELLEFPITYALIVVLAGTAVLQLTYLNRALQRFDSREVIPTQYVLFTLSAIIGAAILFRDFEDVDPHRLINFFFGVAALFGGVFVLTRQHESSSDDDDEEASVESPGSPERIPVNMTLPSVDERPEEPAAAARLQIAAPSSAERRGGRLTRPGLSGTVSTGTQASDPSGIGALGTSATSQASAPWSTSKTPRRNIVGLAPASGGLSQGTYLLLAATSPAKPGMSLLPGGMGLSGASSASRPSRARSSSQPNTPTRRRSRRNLRADAAAGAAQDVEATPSVDAAARRAARQRSPDPASRARRASADRGLASRSATQAGGAETPLDEDMPWASSAADQSRGSGS